MNDINAIRTFNQYKSDFQSNKYNLETIARLVDDIRFELLYFTKNEFSLLIKIPISVLEMDVYISDKDIKNWQKENSEYFHGNVECFNNEFFKLLSNKFLEKKYYVEDVINLAKYYEENFDCLIKQFGGNTEIPLRIVESTLEDVQLINEKNFYSSGNIFAKIVEKAINFI